MDYTPDLMALQGVIMSADSENPFNRISSRGGNEEAIQNIIQSLKKFFLSKRYCNSEAIPEKCKSEFNKLCFFIVLNSDFNTLSEIVDLPNLDHLIWTTPTISSCLFCEIIWSLRMESVIGDIISYCNPNLSINILKALLTGIRYCSAQESVDKLYPLAVASYCSLSRLSFFNYDNALTSTLITELYTYFLRSITHFVSPPNQGKLEEKPLYDRYVHVGKSFHRLLETILEILSIYESSMTFDSDEYGLYLCTINPEKVKTQLLRSVKEDSDSLVSEYLQKCNNAALDKCVEIVMCVSVDVFCTWSEYTENGCSLQRSVGELSYHLCKKLENMPDLSQHILMSMLPQLSCKPADIFDVIKEADDDTLILNAQYDNVEREHWLNAIIERENLFESESFMECLSKGTHFLKSQSCEKLFTKCISYLQQSHYQNNELAKCLALNSFACVEVDKKLDLLCFTFSKRVLHEHLEQPDFEIKINEVFNKLISTSECAVSEIYDIFLQNPMAVYNKILKVGVENVNQSKLMVKVVSFLKPLLEYNRAGDKESAFLNAIEDLCAIPLETEVQENSFVSLLFGLSIEVKNLQTPLLLKIILPYVHKSILNKDFRNLRLHLKVLREAFQVENLVPYRAPLLAMLGQVLSVVRWDFTTYKPEAPATIQEAIELIASLFNSYNKTIPDKDSNWLKTKLKGLTALNMYYFREVWNPPPVGSFLQVITNKENVESDQYPILLAKILNSCTYKEWFMIWQSLISESNQISTLELLYKALETMTITEHAHRTENSRTCIRYCYRCFTSVVKESLELNKLDERYTKEVLEKLTSMANMTSEEDLDDVAAILLPLLSYIKLPEGVSSVEIENKINCGKFAKLVKDVFSQAQ